MALRQREDKDEGVSRINTTAHRDLLKSIKKLFWATQSAQSVSSSAMNNSSIERTETNPPSPSSIRKESDALSSEWSESLSGLRIAPSSPIASATPKARRFRPKEGGGESTPLRSINLKLAPSIEQENDHDSDSEKGLFSPAVWRHEEEEEKELHRVLREQQQAALARVEEQEFGEVEFCPFRFIKSLPPLRHISVNSRPVLPPKSVQNPRISLVLDLDETLVHCSIEPIERAELQFDVEHCGVNYQVFARRRPYFHHFLEKVSKKFEIIVFTASQQVYADKLLDLLDPSRSLFHHRLFRDNCYVHEGNYLKDLRILGRDLSDVVIVDNSPHAFGFQVENGIPIESWFEEDNDEELLHLLPFLEKLHRVDDVRPLISSHFGLQKIIDGL